MVEKVWPPRFRPSLDPNEVMHQIQVLCGHLAKLSGGFSIPQILPEVASSKLARSPLRPVGTGKTHEEVKDERTLESTRLDSGDSSSDEKTQETTQLDSFQASGSDEDVQPTPKSRTRQAQKRKEPPKPTPNATPSPKPKVTRKAQQKVAKPIQPKVKPQQPQPTHVATKGAPTAGSGPRMRDLDLQKAVRKAKGRFVVEDRENRYKQFRESLKEEKRNSGRLPLSDTRDVICCGWPHGIS